MLRSLQIDHIACFCDARLRFESVNLITGPHGSGKSVLALALDTALQLIRSTQPPTELLGANLCCPWRPGAAEISLEIDAEGRRFRYQLIAPFEGARGGGPLSERLLRDAELIYENRASKVAWRAADGTMPTPWVPARGGSLLGGLDESGWPPGRPFQEALRKVRWFWVNTVDLLDRADESHAELDPWLSNFAAWLRGLQQRDPALVARIYEEIRIFVPDFIGLRLNGDPADLFVDLIGPADSPARQLPFNLLSQGQQRLVLLTTLAMGQLAPGVTIWLDEPCSDLQPATGRAWLGRLGQWVRAADAQVVVTTTMERAEEALRPDRWYTLAAPREGCAAVEDLSPETAERV